MGLIVMGLTLAVTAGLGVTALIEIPAGSAVAASFLLERHGRARRARPRRRPPPRA